MAQYHLRVAAGQLHIRFHTGEETNIPLDDATASDTLWNVVTNLESDGEAAASFPEGLLELWLHRTTMAMTSQQMQSMSTEDLVQYMKVCRGYVCTCFLARFVRNTPEMQHGTIDCAKLVFHPSISILSHMRLQKRCVTHSKCRRVTSWWMSIASNCSAAHWRSASSPLPHTHWKPPLQTA